MDIFDRERRNLSCLNLKIYSCVLAPPIYGVDLLG